MQEIEARVEAGEGIGIGIGRSRPANGDGAVDVQVEFPRRVDADIERLQALVQKLLVRNQQLERALESRVLIEQAKGVLAERLELDPEGAFEVLRRAARNNRVKIHELAARVVVGRETPDEIVEALR